VLASGFEQPRGRVFADGRRAAPGRQQRRVAGAAANVDDVVTRSG
jgi:hypothetical protein